MCIHKCVHGSGHACQRQTMRHCQSHWICMYIRVDHFCMGNNYIFKKPRARNVRFDETAKISQVTIYMTQKLELQLLVLQFVHY